LILLPADAFAAGTSGRCRLRAGANREFIAADGWIRAIIPTVNSSYAGSSVGEPGSLTKQSTMKPMEPMSGMKPMSPMKPMEPMKAPVRWWPEELGEQPNSAGGQNEMRYAFFGDQQRLAVDTGDGKVQVYDTGEPSHLRCAATPEQHGKKGHVYEPAGGSRFGDFETGLTNR
jgi:hypothetical protein